MPGWVLVSSGLRLSVLLALIGLLSEPALAQGAGQSTFGYGSSSRRQPFSAFSPYRFQPYALSPHRQWDEDGLEPSRGGGTYRTLCVRLCDGYYFPISSAVTMDGLARDADACSASCGVESRLFYHPSVGGSADSMVDLTGMAYTALGSAFRYRKTLVEGCRCRAQPWSEAERQRHLGYAETPSGEAPRVAKVIAGGDREASAPPHQPTREMPPATTFPPADEAVPATRPEPIARSVEPSPWRPQDSSGHPASRRSRYTWPSTQP